MSNELAVYAPLKNAPSPLFENALGKGPVVTTRGFGTPNGIVAAMGM